MPKVLDCGPLSNDCNTAQGGEYYAHHKAGKPGAGKKGAHPPRAASKKAAARFAMLAKRDAARQAASIFGETLFKRTTRKEDARQRSWLQGASSSPAEDFLKDLAALRGRSQQLHEEGGDGDGTAPDAALKAAGETILQAGDRLDDLQQRLNQRREAVFAEFVGPLALEDKKAPLAVTVDRFAREWVPPGAVKVPSMLKVTPLSSDVAPPPAAYTAQEASSLKEANMGMEGMSLERALEVLNGQQIQLNKERAALFEAAVGGKPLPLAAVMNESPALIEWEGSADLPTVTAASVQPINGFAPPAAAPAPTSAVTENRLQPQEKPAVDYLGRAFVGGSKPHAPAVPAPGSRAAGAGQSDVDASHVSRWADERPTVHHANPRNKVADLMKELDVSGIAPETSFTKDPYDPWQPKKAPESSAGTAATSLHAAHLAASSPHAPARVPEEHAQPAAGGASSYKTATQVFKAASAAYDAASATWKDLEAKEAQAQAVQAKLQRQQHAAKHAARAVAHTASSAAGQEVAVSGARATGAAQAAGKAARELPHPAAAAQADTAKAGAGASGGGAEARGADAERSARQGKEEHGARTGPSAPKGAAPHREPRAGKKGLPEYKATDAHADLNSFFDSLIAHRVAVGHDRYTAPHLVAHPFVSEREAERRKEDRLLQASDLRRVSAKELEQAEEQTADKVCV